MSVRRLPSGAVRMGARKIADPALLGAATEPLLGEHDFEAFSVRAGHPASRT